jgi:hypothetical protein
MAEDRNRTAIDDDRIEDKLDPVESGKNVPSSGLAGADIADDAQNRHVGRPFGVDQGVAQRDRHPLDTDED